MDSDRVELMRQLFVVMSELAEGASESTMNGQGLHRSVTPYARAAARVQSSAQDLMALAQAVIVLARRA